MKLLELPEQGKNLVKQGLLKFSSAADVLSLETEKAREEVLAYVEKFSPSVRELANYTRARRLDEEQEMQWDVDAEYAAKKAGEAFETLEVEVLRFADRGKTGTRPVPVEEELPEDAIAPSMRSFSRGMKIGELAAWLKAKCVVGSLRPHVADSPPVVLVDLELLRTAESLLPEGQKRWLVADDAETRREQALENKRGQAKQEQQWAAMQDELVSAVKMMLEPSHSSEIFRMVFGEWLRLEPELGRMEVLDVLASAMDCQRDEEAHEEDEDWIEFVRGQAMEAATASQVVEVLFFIDALTLLVGMDSPSMAAVESGRSWWNASGLELEDFPAWGGFLK
jgi:hypothetical protein